MCFDMLLQILWTLEGLSAEITFVGLERNVNTDMRGDVVALDGGGAAVAPLAGEIQVVGALAADVTLANMILHAKSAAQRHVEWNREDSYV